MSDVYIDFGKSYFESSNGELVLRDYMGRAAEQFVRTCVGRYYTRGSDIYKSRSLIRTVEVGGREEPQLVLDKSYVIQLGGEFEKIGEADETVGGGNQKVGSANK